MLISHKWIQSYFENPIPEPEELATILTLHSFEIEGIEKKQSADGEYEDTIIDIKVLPDRAPFALSHRYMAEEIGTLIRQDVKWPEITEVTEAATKRSLAISFDDTVEQEELCRRYIGRVVENVTVTDSPSWLKYELEVLGQRSINSIVDLTNYVMLETGEPMHAFDADKVEGVLMVRMAKEGSDGKEEKDVADGEEIVLLDGSTVKLSSTNMVIADEKGPLAVAGIKGGKRAEVTSETKNIILEAASFNRSNVRRTSQALGIRSESSKRFENGVTPERAGLAMAMLTGHLSKLNPDAVIGEAVDIYPHRAEPVLLEVNIADIHARLGVEIARDKITDILTRLGLEIEEVPETLKLGIPPHRSDLRITEDIAEEVGRVYGYDKISERVPEPRSDRKINKNFHYFSAIRQALAAQGFSETYTYTLVDSGDMAIQNPLTSERSHLRNSITDILPAKFLLNMKNIDLLGLKEIRIFEIGKIFSNKKERSALAFGVARAKLPKGIDAKAELAAMVENLVKMLGGDISNAPEIKYTEIKGDAQTPCAGMMAEIELDSLIAALPEPTLDIDLSSFVQSISDDRKYKAISQYPFSVRDVAVFVPGAAGKENEVLATIQGALTDEQKNILAKTTLFDVFTKDAKTSYAYRLIFQSSERTLTQEEVDAAMKAITEVLNAQEGWSVR